MVGNTAFGMMFPILAGYIAMAIADRPALLPGIVGGLLAKAGTSVFLPKDQWVSSGFFGTLIAGFVAGCLMVLIKKLLDKLPKSPESTKPVLLYPFPGILAMDAIMFPMIISVNEVRRIKEILEEVKKELTKEGIAFRKDVELGVMIETPAAVMVSRELAKEVDLLEMIRMAAANAHAEGKWIGICGELAADLSLTETFLEMKIDELSVAPGMVLPLRKRIREAR